MNKFSFKVVGSFHSKPNNKGKATQPRKSLIERSMRGRRKGLRRIRREEGVEAYELARAELYAELEARANPVAQAA